MKRREFLKISGCSLAAVAVSGAGGWSLFGAGSVAHAASGHLQLTMVEADAEMVDGVRVPMWAFSSDLLAADGLPPLGARIPGPIIFAVEGEKIRLRLQNQIANGGAHGFAVPGVVESDPVPFGEETEVAFDAPAAGTYLYFDPFNAPVNRVMGLHGALVVFPKEIEEDTPYSDPTSSIRRLFADLGTTSHFPGHPWDPDRNAVWIFNVVDPDKNSLAFDSPGGIDPAAFLDDYTPQYFTLNGKSGFFAAQHGHEVGEGDHGHGLTSDAQSMISVRGNVGQPALIRSLNAGLMWHSPHIHGNHLYLLTENGTVFENLEMVDTWSLPPLARKDLLLPFIAPPDIPANFWQRAAAGINDEIFPLFYPMHDHNEISNTAAGGNYPQGLATHWQIDGHIDPADEVLRITRAELRVRTGQLLIEGRSSGAAGNILAVHAGADAAGPTIGTVTVRGDGTWSFRGRGLKVLASRRITVHNHATGAERRNIPVQLR